jgi:hypothetical protein
MSGRRGYRRPLVLLAFLAAIAGGAMLLERGRAARPGDVPLLGIGAADVSAVLIQEGSRELRAMREAGEWRIQGPAGPLDRQAVEAVVGTLASLVPLDVFERSDLDRAAIGLDPPRARVQLDVTGRSRPIVLLFGDYTPSGGTVYGALDGDPRLFRIGVLVVSEIERALYRSRAGDAD